MDLEKYYEFSDDLYCVIFPNKKGLTIEQIKKIFSEFGAVVDVNKAGDDFGYRFVKYRQKDEVLQCIKGLQNHPSISLKIPKPNMRKNRNQTNSNNQFVGPDGSKHSENSGEKSELREQKKFDTQKVTRVTNNFEETVKNQQEPQNVKFKTQKPSASLCQPAVTTEAFMSENVKKCTMEGTEHSLEPLNNTLDLDSNKSSVQADMHKNVLISTDSAALKHKYEGIPRLIKNNSAFGTTEALKISQTVPMPLTATAEEVIVANIHTDFGVHYILHLIEKYNPICVSEMKIIPPLGIRYCIIYMPSPQEALAVEEELRNFKLSGTDLIALRPESLVEQSMIS